jgi:hypothetical protein
MMRLWYIFVEACARLCESPTASGANVGDITPDIPKYPYFMTNMHYVYQIIYAGYSEIGKTASWAGIYQCRPAVIEPKPA